ncbi:AAA family ATPase [Methylovulum psychrotolerans]|uniref:DNA repair protein n=1 Tax=Methylovulum psychrotolerans TaxID=1704499 RepID=A0A1Z4C2J6_9GAMM|nr:AAA family ATPase [Methylovulum psychrotolerans]ASF47767.1 DNA repair protein [Methylovulum psychrotolerans]
MTSSEPKTVLQYIFEWSLNRPLWQRDALRRIVSNGRLDPNIDINELTELCKQGISGITTGIQAIPLEISHLPANPAEMATISLLSIKNVNGVNNLASGQSLAFEHNGLTVIYGDNGAGKSGYARIFKRACRARHAGVIQPNIYAQGGSIPASPSATFTYSIGGVEQSPEIWENTDKPHPVFSAISVFDSNCAAVHINDKNEVAFRPFGLDIPDELVTACQSIKESLVAEKTKLEKAKNPIFATPAWKADTAVGKELAALNHKTNIQRITDLGTLSEDESIRLIRLREDLSKNPKTAASEQKIKADNIKRLIHFLGSISNQTTDEALQKIFDIGQDANVKREAARIAAEKAFSSESLKGVGDKIWRILWDSARHYSTHAYPNQPFPPSEKNALCVLCQQTLTGEARERMARFEDFIKNDVEKHAQEAETSFNNAYKEFSEQNFAYRSFKPTRLDIALQRPDLAKQIFRFIASAKLRRYLLAKSLLNNVTLLPFPSLPYNPKESLEQLEKTIREYSLELEKSASGEERKKLEKDFSELSDREILHGMLPTVIDEINRFKSINFLVECQTETTTTAITRLGNEIADSVISPRLRDKFQEEIVKLAADKVRVEMVRSGGKLGSPQYQIRLFAKPDAKVGVILSEGEQTCVALAAFLTELATAMHRSAIVFDDPVSSLDHRWRKKVAERLVEEAQNRQVIVLTHDLVFVNDLNDLSFGKNCPVKSITISRGAQGTGIVSEGLPWQGKSIEDRIDKLEKSCREAQLSYVNNQDDKYRQQAANIYNNLRASWERALEDIAFSRVVQRHRDYINTKDLKKVAVLSEEDCNSFHAGFKKCCDIVDAHDPSSARNGEVPTPQEIIQDIQALKDWSISLKDRQKTVR